MELVKHIDFIVQFSNKLNDIYFKVKDNGQLSHEDSFLYIFNSRINRIFYSISLLLNSNPKQHEEFGLFVLLRPLIQDCLYVLYVRDQLQSSTDKDSRFLNLSKVAISDGLERHKGFIDRAQEVGKIDSNEHEKMYGVIMQMNQTLINSEETVYPGKIILKNFRLNGNEKFNATNLFDFLKTTEKRDVAWKLYNLYYNYSKYDHFTIDSIKMSNYFDKVNKEDSVAISVYMIIDQFYSYLEILDFYNNEQVELKLLFEEYGNWLKEITVE